MVSVCEKLYVELFEKLYLKSSKNLRGFISEAHKMGFHNAHLTFRWKHRQEASMPTFKKLFWTLYFEEESYFQPPSPQGFLCSLVKGQVYHEATSKTVKLSVKLLLSSMHKSKRLFELFNIQLFNLAFPSLFL